MYESNWVYRKKYAFILKYVPDYLYGDSTSGIFDKIINEDFMNSKINKKEYITNKCVEIFSLDKKNKPRWIQEPEWPVVNGSPLKFVKQIREYDKVKFYFINNNDEYVVVEQFY